MVHSGEGLLAGFAGCCVGEDVSFEPIAIGVVSADFEVVLRRHDDGSGDGAADDAQRIPPAFATCRFLVIWSFA